MENKLNLTRQVILATRNATLAYHNYMYTDREYVKGHKLYLREMHFLLFVGISKELTMSEIAEKMNITQGAATQIAGRLLKKKLIQKREIQKTNVTLLFLFHLMEKMYISNT